MEKVNAAAGTNNYINNEVIVELKDPKESVSSASNTIFTQVVSGFRPIAMNVQRETHIRKNRGARFLLQIADGTDPQVVAKKLLNRPGVLSASPNFIYHTAQTSNDTNFALKDDLYNTGSNSGRTSETKDADIDAEIAWNTTKGAGSVIAVIDTGVQLTHPDLDGNLWTNPDEPSNDNADAPDGNTFIGDTNGWDFVSHDNNPNPAPSGAETGHGTHVAGIAAAEVNNSAGIAGVAPEAKIMVLRAFDGNGSATSDDVIAAIDYAIQNDANVINMSFATGPGEYDTSFDAPLQDAYNNNIVPVAAAGNDNIDLNSQRVSPVTNDCGSTDCVIGVAATSNADYMASYSNFSSGANKYVDVSAPGGVTVSSRAIYSTLPGSTYGYEAGTSMATPQVTGLVALLHATNPSLTASQIISQIRNNTDPANSSNIGTGRINAAHAVNNSIMSRFDASGGNHYSISNQVSQMRFPQDGTATSVLIASGTNFPDALAGGGLAKSKTAPLILTSPSGLSSSSLTEIQRALSNSTKKIYILGGTSAVSSNIETQLSNVGYANTERVAGDDRVDTAIAIANITNPSTTSYAFVVNKDNFPDGLAASAISAAKGIPVLVNGAGSLDARNSSWLTAHHVSRVFVVGGTSVVTDTVKNQIGALGISVTRLAGADRYATSYEVARCFYSTSATSVCNGVVSSRAKPKQVGYATGIYFQDALTAGPYMGYYAGPVLLVSSSVSSSVTSYDAMIQGTARDGFVFGTTSNVSPSVLSTLAAQLK